MRKPEYGQNHRLLAGTAVGKAERNAEFGENQKNSREEGFPVSEPGKGLWKGPKQLSP